MDTPGWAATAFHITEEEEEQTSGFMCGVCGGCVCARERVSTCTDAVTDTHSDNAMTD